MTIHCEIHGEIGVHPAPADSSATPTAPTCPACEAARRAADQARAQQRSKRCSL